MVLSELREMCKFLDEFDGVSTWIQGDSIFTNNGIEIRTTINFDDYGQYKFIVIHDHTFSEEMNFFDALYFAETVLRGKCNVSNNYQTC